MKDFQILNTLFNYYEGTLWYIQEELTKERDEKYDQTSTRKAHPFLSIRTNIVIGNEKIPMIIGSSKKRRKHDFIVKNVFDNNSITWFGSKTVAFKASDFFIKKKEVSKKKENSHIKTIKTKLMIEKNSFKTKLNDEEMVLLKQWKQQKGYRI